MQTGGRSYICARYPLPWRASLWRRAGCVPRIACGGACLRVSRFPRGGTSSSRALLPFSISGFSAPGAGRPILSSSLLCLSLTPGGGEIPIPGTQISQATGVGRGGGGPLHLEASASRVRDSPPRHLRAAPDGRAPCLFLKPPPHRWPSREVSDGGHFKRKQDMSFSVVCPIHAESKQKFLAAFERDLCDLSTAFHPAACHLSVEMAANFLF